MNPIRLWLDFGPMHPPLGTVHLIFWGGGGGGGGAWVFFEKNFLALFLAKKNNLAQWPCEKNNLSPIVTQNSLIGMFEMSKSQKFSASLRSPEEYQIQIVFKC